MLPFPILEICVNEDHCELLELYRRAIDEHNRNVEMDPHANSGFDLFTPSDTEFRVPYSTQLMDLHVKTQMWDDLSQPSAFYIYPRSSLSKTQLMLSNHVGIIDSGYRNNLMCAFRYLPPVPSSDASTYVIPKHTRLTQICHPSLKPFLVRLIDENELTTTTRTGGFGSTGGTV